MPPEVQTRLRAINTPEHLGNLANKITQLDGLETVDLRERLTFLDKAGWAKEAGECEIDLAHRAIKENRIEEGFSYLEKAVSRFSDAVNEKEVGELFLPAALEFSNLCFSLGQGFTGLEKVLLKASETAEKLGDQRANVLLNLHLGRLFYFSDRRDDALFALSMGFEEIEELDDEDIREQSAEFLGILFFIKGHFREALEQFDKAEKIRQSFLERFNNESPDSHIAGILCCLCGTIPPGYWKFGFQLAFGHGAIRPGLGQLYPGCSGRCFGPVEKR